MKQPQSLNGSQFVIAVCAKKRMVTPLQFLQLLSQGNWNLQAGFQNTSNPQTSQKEVFVLNVEALLFLVTNHQMQFFSELLMIRKIGNQMVSIQALKVRSRGTLYTMTCRNIEQKMILSLLMLVQYNLALRYVSQISNLAFLPCRKLCIRIRYLYPTVTPPGCS